MSSQTMERFDTGQVEVLALTPAERDELLNDAEARLRHVAMAQRSAGILVTRHNPGRYTLKLCPTVPFGQTWEKTLA